MPLSCRRFVRLSTASAGTAAAGWRGVARGQSGRAITVSHSVSAFVYGRHRRA